MYSKSTGIDQQSVIMHHFNNFLQVESIKNIGITILNSNFKNQDKIKLQIRYQKTQNLSSKIRFKLIKY